MSRRATSGLGGRKEKRMSLEKISNFAPWDVSGGQSSSLAPRPRENRSPDGRTIRNVSCRKFSDGYRMYSGSTFMSFY
ncbi:hypothetical protein AV530_019131 [Patagioenas fasciata monilis]|uniref:Uncharacterized protein n=1 Tax=Patagioenas fasciata monilis TaxID=372326 RepID=A0A1V4KXA7_PATFA|nr:hypothetical protein AV530_019131 [Patagioenas fasciata monilis]